MTNTLIIATIEELRLLTKREREVYEMFRSEGLRRDEICAKLHLNKESFRRYWWSAVKKIRMHRRMTENPQWYLARGRDILAGDGVHVERQRPADTRTISNRSMLGRTGIVGDGEGTESDDGGDEDPEEEDSTLAE